MITTSKAQRQSFSGVGELDLNDTDFSHGQIFVGISSVTHSDDLKVCLSPSSNSQIKNVVYPEALA